MDPILDPTMPSREALREVFAAFAEVDPRELRSDFPLRGARLQGSVGRYALDAALRRRLGVSTPAVFTAATLGQLESALFSEDVQNQHPLAAAAPPISPPRGMGEAVTCGVDLEHAAHLPEAVDYWMHSFYQEAFTPRELAYCLMQEHPRLHLAARWCAKEAVRKAMPEFMSIPFRETEVVRDRAGAPSLILRRGNVEEPIPCSLSLTHSGSSATAVVISDPVKK